MAHQNEDEAVAAAEEQPVAVAAEQPLSQLQVAVVSLSQDLARVVDLPLASPVSPRPTAHVWSRRRRTASRWAHYLQCLALIRVA